MSFCKSDQKSMPVVGFLTRNGSGMFCRPKLGYIGALDTRLISCLQQAQVQMEMSLNSYLANSSPFKSDIGSLRGKIECLDTQRAGEVDFFEFKVLSDCCLDGRCWVSSQVEIMAPTMLNAETLDLDSMLWGGPGVSKCPEKDRDDGHEEHHLL